MTRSFSLLLFSIGFILPLSAQQPATGGIQITWNFDNGSLGGWVVNASGEIALSHTPQSGELWYYFQVDGVEGKTLTFVFDDARKDFYGGDSLPAISYDRESWSFVKNRTIQPHPSDLNRVRYSFTHTFASNRAWLAFTPPYPNKRLDGLIREITSHPHVSIETLCQTPIRHLPISIISITDPETPNIDKHGVLFLAREEAMESASSWVCEGLVRFLLSDDPVAAAIKRRCIILLVPIFDRDGVALGSAVHPLAENGGNIYWTETWPESSYSFYEQRQMKRFLQGWQDNGKNIHYSFRICSSAWNQDHMRREHCAEPLVPAQEAFYGQIVSGKYLPWYRNLDRILQDTRFSKFVAGLYPDIITGLCQCEYRYDKAFGLNFSLYKTTDDLQTDGELLAYALAEALGVPASDPPPFLHAAEMYEIVGAAGQIFHVRCVYRDLLNRPPEYVRVTVGEQSSDLKPVRLDNGELNYQTGVLFTGFISSKETIAVHSFSASNGSRTRSLPQNGTRIGPLLYPSSTSKQK